MRIDRDFLVAFVDRFKVDVDENWLQEKFRLMEFDNVEAENGDDPAMLLRQLELNLDRIYVPTKESIRIGKWLYSIARGFIAERYRSPQLYVDICLAKIAGKDPVNLHKFTKFSADSVPIYAIDGLPGAGKSALFRSLQRVFPPPLTLTAEGNPPQRIGTISALWMSVSVNFSLKDWLKDTLIELGVDKSSLTGNSNIGSLSQLMFKTLYRLGVGAILVDELQFASGRSSALRVLALLLSMRNFGVPIIFFANSDLLKIIDEAPGQVTQRIPADRRTFSPALRGDPVFKEILGAQLSLVPFGHDIDLENEAHNIYDMVAGLPRASGKLIMLGGANSIPGRRKLTMLDLVEAKRSAGFDSFRMQIALLMALSPVDAKKRPELASNNDQFDEAAAYQKQMDEQRLENAAALALFGQLCNSEREAWLAAETRILRASGKIPANVKSVGEAKRARKTKLHPDEILKNSYAAKRLAKFPTKNPTDRS